MLAAANETSSTLSAEELELKVILEQRRAEMEKTFNMGVGMVAVVSPDDTDRALAILTARHLDRWVLGTVKKARKNSTRAELVGQHPRF